LIYDPAQRLRDMFRNHDVRFVAFVEIAELEKIEAYKTDSAINLVKEQIQEFHRDDFEIGLHLHPQWSKARYDNGRWSLDFDEYNLCKLPKGRILEIIDNSLAYLRNIIGQPDFTPLSFRAGNWLFQPTQTAASVLAEKGIRIDSSVFKGGLQHHHDLDYRPALRNGYYWPFSGDVNEPDPMGPWMEVPIHTDMVPSWKMPTPKRMAFTNQFGTAGRSTRQKLTRALDFMRLRYPLKLDFCRMTLDELTSMMGRIIREDRKEPDSYRPVVAIGHTKDLTDYNTVESFLLFLKANRILISTFRDIYPKLTKISVSTN
jgi:hypothetical protein